MQNAIRAGLSLLALACSSQLSHGLTFNFNRADGVTDEAYYGFVEAGNRWSELFFDPITVNIDVKFEPLGPGIIGGTDAAKFTGPFSAYKLLMQADASSVADFTAVANLPGGTTVDALMNRTTKFGGTATPYLDNDGSHNNQIFVSSSAQLKALGFLAPNDPTVDATISFSSSMPFDFNPSDGISGSALDFVGMATHEIGHALGFFSNVDTRDFFAQLGNFSEDTAGREQSVMDFFRFSGAPGVNAQRDWTVGSADKFFSIDNGATSVGEMSTGIYFGDGRQASHWKDNLGIGILDPTTSLGELMTISPADILALDVLGYNPVPEANTIWAGFAFGALGLWQIRRRRSA